MIPIVRIALLLPSLFVATSQIAAQAGPYKVLKTQTVGGEGGYDYVTADSASRKLYIARSGPKGTLHVYNLDTLAPLGEIPTGSAHGAAIDPALHHGFATSKPVTMFDTESMKVIKTIDTGGNPDGYLVDTDAHRVYILSHSEPNVTVLDAHDGSFLGSVNLGGAPEQSVLDGKGHMYIDLEDKDAIAVVDTASLKLLTKYDISSKGGGCAGLAIDRENGVLFAACRDKSNMIILSVADGEILTTLPIGVGCDGAVFNPETSEVFSTQGDGTLTVIQEDSRRNRVRSLNAPSKPLLSFSIEQTVATPPRARTISLDSKTGDLFTVTADFGPTPPPAPGQKYSRAPMVPGTFKIVVVGK